MDLEKQLKRMESSLGKNSDIAKIMAEEGNRLMKIIQKYIDAYYDDPNLKPNYYVRTHAFQNSLRIEPVKREGNRLSIRIYFDSGMAHHPSVMGGTDGYVPLLINDGWQWKNDPGIYRFSYYGGYNFIEKAIAEYNRTNPYGFKIDVKRAYGGNEY